MRRFPALPALCILAAGFAGTAVWTASASVQDPKPPGGAEKTGEQVGKAFDKVGKSIREGFRDAKEGIRDRLDAAREAVDEMNVASRVYSRLHWDKDLATADLDVTVQETTVTLKGGVPDDAARTKAVRLANETLGVAKVLDDLVVKPGTGQPTGTTTIEKKTTIEKRPAKP